MRKYSKRSVKPFVDRFWEKVQKTDSCWIWTGAIVGWKYKSGVGYGYIGRGRREDGGVCAHRASWEIHNGDIPDGMQVLHRCDNPLCVNPEHLFIGTQKDNINDMVEKGRNIPGRQKLCHSQVVEIRTLYKTGAHTYKTLSEDFGVSIRQIGRIINKENWL